MKILPQFGNRLKIYPLHQIVCGCVCVYRCSQQRSSIHNLAMHLRLYVWCSYNNGNEGYCVIMVLSNEIAHHTQCHELANGINWCAHLIREKNRKQILASVLFIQTNSFILIEWDWKRWPWFRCWCLRFIPLFWSSSSTSLWLLSSLSSSLLLLHPPTFQYYCVSVSISTLLPHTHSYSVPHSQCWLLPFFWFISFGRKRLRCIKFHGITSKSNVFKCDLMVLYFQA